MKTRKLVTALAAGAIGVVAFGSPALAHVTIDPSEAAQGSTTKIALSLEDESTTSDTVKVDVKLPDEVASASVSVEPTAGWTAELVRSATGEVSEIVWTTTTPAPGDLGPFTMALGPLPDQVTELSFPTIQTYGDGAEDAWIEPPLPDGGEPEHPAPTLKLTAAQGTSTSSSSPTSTSSSSSTTTAAPVATAVKADDDSKAPLIIGIVVVLAVLAGIGLYVRSKRRPADAP